MSVFESRIIVTDPENNMDPKRRFTYPSSWMPGFIVEETNLESILLAFAMGKDGLSPALYPKAIELFAGDGPWARRLIDNGWKEENVTCIDNARTSTPLVSGVNWKYVDLILLNEAIRAGIPIPEEIIKMKGMFDIVCLSYGPVSGNKIFDPLIRFFAREDGYMLGDQQGQIS